MATAQAKIMSSSGLEVFSLKKALHRNGAMTKADVTSIVWLVGAAEWMIGAAIVVVPPLDPAPRRPPPLGMVAAAAGTAAVAALVGVAA
jgi:hypothetical protein